MTVADQCYICREVKPDWRLPCAAGHDDGQARVKSFKAASKVPGTMNRAWWLEGRFVPDTRSTTPADRPRAPAPEGTEPVMPASPQAVRPDRKRRKVRP